MELLEWRDEYATGIPDIDYEHEQLIDSINAFYSKLAEDPNKEELVEVLDNIYGAIYSHFVLEEKLMKKYGYDEFKQHSQDHARLLDEIRDITLALEDSSEYDEQKLKQRMNDWFSIHFKTHDARLHRLEELKTVQDNKSRGLLSFLGESRLSRSKR
jgi:hemerythrin